MCTREGPWRTFRTPAAVGAQAAVSPAGARAVRKQTAEVDAQMATAAARLARARAARRAADAHQRALQRHVGPLKEVADGGEGGGWPTEKDAEEIRAVRRLLAEKERAFEAARMRLEETGSEGGGREAEEVLKEFGVNGWSVSWRAQEKLNEVVKPRVGSNGAVEEIKDYENISAGLL